MSLDAASGTLASPRTWWQRVRNGAPVEAVASVGALLVAWVIVAEFTPPYILPQITVVLADVRNILFELESLDHVVRTLVRILAGLAAAFVIGTGLGLAMGRLRRLDRALMPPLQMIQGIPSLSWVIIAIIWFQTVELRIWFIVLMVTLPGFVFQALDSYRAVPRELRDMARSLRPRRLDLFRTVTLPAIVPDLLTAWKVNLGLGTRVVLVAELVGAAIGVGYQLRTSEQMFDMSGVMAWTAVLVLFVLLVQSVISRIERHLLRYRQQGEDQQAAPPPEQTQQPAAVSGEGAGGADR
ncbi:ABC transporter permease [Egibacter rhizosphaerae]|uniref:ABC transporter permease n=1 Tax=Egibacter rhizosphaerae TaxID=1670831 RepID=A0A411YC38_9ACTN|nr:ABC transporter permease [Egibacter rhizosphaerae]QBI18801.1 ABC transporter permease [Egibacter rhizosphaerae]